MGNNKNNLIDKPIHLLEDDSLGIAPYVEALSTVIENCATPMTISIQGNWGTGKTSFMNLVENKLKKEDGLKTVVFNTWQYSKFNMDDMLSVSLLNRFAESIIPDDSKSKDKIKKIIESISFTSLDLISKGILSKEKITKLFSSGSILSTADQLYKLKTLLQGEVDALIKSKDCKRIIVFIDDLDRLKPKNAVELLEVLQLFLTIENCVFVLAVDYEVVTQGIKHKMGAEYSDEKARNFFDKIIQLPFNIPVETNDIVTEYVEGMLASIPMLEVEEIKNTESYVNLLNKSVRFNPRNTKRIINTFWLLRLVALKTKENSNEFLDFDLPLFAVLCMQISYRRIYINLLTLIDENEDDALESLLSSEITEDTLQEHFIDEMSDSNPKCIGFLNEFRNIFIDSENFDLKLLKEVMTLSQSTAEETVQEDQLVAAVVIRGIETASFEKIADKLKENYPDIIDTISNFRDSQDAVLVRFKYMVGKSYRSKIKQTLIDNGINHKSVIAHSYDYYGKPSD